MTERHSVSRPVVAFADERGTITDLVQGEAWDSVSVITSHKGAVRGNHYHAETVQVLYVVSGLLEVVTQMPGEDVVRERAVAGDLVRTVPVERHAILAREDSTFVVFTRGPRAGADYESDTFRLDEPLVSGD